MHGERLTTLRYTLQPASKLSPATATDNNSEIFSLMIALMSASERSP